MEKNDSQGLVLYEYFACPFCFRTRHAIKQLGVQIERRDIIQNPHHKRGASKWRRENPGTMFADC